MPPRNTTKHAYKAAQPCELELGLKLGLELELEMETEMGMEMETEMEMEEMLQPRVAGGSGRPAPPAAGVAPGQPGVCQRRRGGHAVPGPVGPGRRSRASRGPLLPARCLSSSLAV